jgi:hypothetical protein
MPRATKKHAPPAYRSSAPVCDCGSGIPRSETAEIPSSGGRRGCDKCYNRKYAAYADTDGGGAEYSDDPSSGSGWHYSRNPPQNFTITSGGRRIRVAGGNVFPSKRDALAAAAYLRATDGGDYRVRALKPGDSVVRVAVANGKKSTRAGKKRGATGVRRSMSNGRTKSQTETSNPFADAHERRVREWYADQTDNRLRSLYTGAWDANDADGARYAVAEMKRRGFDTSMYRWPGL